MRNGRSARARWVIFDHFIVRRAGFSFDLLEGLGCARATEAAESALSAEQAAAQARLVLLEREFPRAVHAAREAGDRDALRALSRTRAAVGRSRTVELGAAIRDDRLAAAHARWLRSEAEHAVAVRHAAAVLASDRNRAAAVLRDLGEREDVREALFLQSPRFLASLEQHSGEQPAKRVIERRLFAYLQRLAAKNETTSFFGPVTEGHVDDAVPSVAIGPETATGVVERTTFCSFWAAAAIAWSASDAPEIAARLPVRRVPVASVRNGVAVVPSIGAVALDDAERRIVAEANGARTVLEIAARTGLEPELVESRVTALEHRLVLARRIEPSSTSSRPLHDVLAQLPDVPAAAPLRSGAEELLALLQAAGAATNDDRRALFAQAERRFEQLTRRSAHRKGGEIYADRTIFFEDCRGDAPVSLPRTLAGRLERTLAPIFDLYLAIGQRRREAIRAFAAEVLDEHGGEMEFVAFADALAQRAPSSALEAHLRPVRELEAAFAERVRRASDGRVARLEAGDLEDLAIVVDRPAFVSPDIMLGGDPTSAPIVLGELHPYVSNWGLQGALVRDPETLARDFAPWLQVWGGPAKLATVLHRRRHKGLVSDAFPGTFVEVTGSAGRSSGRRVAVSALRVLAGEDGPILRGPDGPLELYVGEHDHLHLRAFAPSQVEPPRLHFGDHTPRVVVGDVVIQRERWELTDEDRAVLTGTTGSGVEQFLAVRRMATRRGWPRHVFVHGFAETKPMYLELTAPWAHEWLASLAAQGPVSICEMLPAPEQLWLHRSGGRFTSELRMAFLRSGS